MHTATATDLFTASDPGRRRERLARLATVLDPFTHRRLTEAGIRPGARCLEIGAGSGSVAAWMAEQAGPSGRVVATDIDISGLGGHPGVTVIEHDIATDPLRPLAGDAGFDLVHARLVLSRVAGRWALIGRLAELLAPGGAVVVEEFDGGWDRYVVQTPDTQAYRLFADYHEAMTGVLETSGKDLHWELVTAMCEAGLSDVDQQMWTRAWRGGQPGCQLLRDTIELEPLRGKLVAAGISGADLDSLGELLNSPRLFVYLHPIVSTIGRRHDTVDEVGR